MASSACPATRRRRCATGSLLPPDSGEARALAPDLVAGHRHGQLPDQAPSLVERQELLLRQPVAHLVVLRRLLREDQREARLPALPVGIDVRGPEAGLRLLVELPLQLLQAHPADGG